MSEASAQIEEYLTAFDRFEKRGAGPAWVRAIRKEAIARFAALGFPTTKDEEWKYTNVAPMLKVPFVPAPSESDGVNSAEAIERLTSVGAASHRLIFVNGCFSQELSSHQHLPEGVTAGSLREALAGDPAAVRSHLARYADFQSHAFVALNTALMEDGALVYVPKGVIVNKPIFLLFVTVGSSDATVTYPRNLIVADRESQVTVVEGYFGLEGRVYLTNGVTEIVAGESAVVDHYRLLRDSDAAFHVATQQAYLGRSANFTSHLIALGGALVRNDINAVLEGEGIECTLNGLFLATGQQHIDNHTRIDHVKPHCMSRELYKGILDGKARGVFNGKIYVHNSAPKTDAKQTNKNLLLSGEASVDTKPQLEIYNNDVKCTHGSTIGQIGRDALFYLRSRGIGLKEARDLLTYAFASEVIRGIRVDLIRDQLHHLTMSRLGEIPEAKERLL